jgi:hypothetical protein
MQVGSKARVLFRGSRRHAEKAAAVGASGEALHVGNHGIEIVQGKDPDIVGIGHGAPPISIVS